MWAKLIAWAVAIASVALACGGSAHATPSQSPNVVYGFAGLTAEDKDDEVQALRATITWTVAPRSSSPYSVSTWIAFAAPAGDTTGGNGVSYRIVQIGWIQKSPNDYRLFWEWDTSPTDHHFKTGGKVEPGMPLRAEIDRDTQVGFTLHANDVLLASVQVGWTPTSIGIFAETHSPTDYLPGSSAKPEIISGLEREVGGRWAPYQGSVFSTNDQYRVSVGIDDPSVVIWDARQ